MLKPPNTALLAAVVATIGCSGGDTTDPPRVGTVAEPVEHEVGTMAEPDLEKLEDTKKPEDKKPEVRKVGKFAEPDRVGLHVAPDLKGEEHPPAERKPQPPDTQPK